MGKYKDLMTALEAIEDADMWEGKIIAVFLEAADDGKDAEVEINVGLLERLAEAYRKLEKENQQLENQLDAIKQRMSDVLEDF